ncbi:programmed cell death protein 6-like isoform X2 [Oscarella lobularis]|uniref:programmed cell death protein 6-like isoform X2 n=1 Tax=Oscarella lobularis TaxID=121494 RepID=UPI0033134199
MSWGQGYHQQGHRPSAPGYGASYGSAPPPAAHSGYGAPPPAQAHYGQQEYHHSGHGYGQPGGYAPSGPSGAPPGVDPTLFAWFQAVDADRSGSISSVELRQALVNGNWSHFNQETCRLMIGMFDKDKSGTIDVHEFAALWKYIQDWKSCFDSFDRDRSGSIDAGELHQAFTSFGYRLSIDFCRLCVHQFDRADVNTMKLDDFIQCCVMLKCLTDAFRRFDVHQTGVINVSYEQFLEMALDNTLSI